MEQPVYSLEWLLDALQRHGLLSEALRRDVEVRAPQQRARLLRQKTVEGARMHPSLQHVSPAEIVASFELIDSTGGLLDDHRIAEVVAREAGLEAYKIDPLELDMGLVTRTLSCPFALRHVVLPIAMGDGGQMRVAVENPFDIEVVENLQRISRGPIRRVVSTKRDIVKAITEIYGFRRSIESAAQEARGDWLYDFEQLVTLRHVGDIEASDQHVVNAVDFLFRYAFDQRASDIHIEPRREGSQVRLRIDGVLHDTHTIPRQVHPAVVSRLKTLARMDIAEKRRPQDGRIKTLLDAPTEVDTVAEASRAVELRVSTLPVAFGEKLVIRIFDPDVLLQDLPNLGFESEDHGLFERWITRPHGLVLVTGPTGSGKTTTLYAALGALVSETVNVTSVEDPIEMITDRFNQVAVQSKIGLDFASTLRAILRQDPDVIMVGEIRDRPTAEMAVQAALTGHLVLSTLHTNDSVGAITRLLDLGVPPFLLASTLVGVVAQRLVRRICRRCLQAQPLTADQMVALGLEAVELPRLANVSHGVGCPACRGTGYYGRIGVFEMLDISPPLAAHITIRPDEEALRQTAVACGTRPLRQGALARLGDGTTTFDEVVRVLGRV